MTALIAVLALSDEKQVRMLLVVPILVFFESTFLLFQVEYDKRSMVAWKEKEKQIEEELALKLVRYYKNLGKYHS